MTNVLRMVPRERPSFFVADDKAFYVQRDRKAQRLRTHLGYLRVEKLWRSLGLPGTARTSRQQITDNQARTGTFPRPGTLFASTLKGKGSAMSVSVLVPALGRKNQRAEALQ